MEFKYRYNKQSNVSNNNQQTDMSFSPDSLRPPTYFVGELNNKIAFREAISALHNVVISDMRFKPRDSNDYKQWLAQEEDNLLGEFLTQFESNKEKIDKIRTELSEINRNNQNMMSEYYQAQHKYFKYLYKHDMDAWYVLDPVITIHPDEVFFECFSDDESSYGKLSCSLNTFDNISDIEYGTTNIDYSENLYNEFQKIRNYRKTNLAIDPDGFKIQTSDEEEFEEKKIDLPESWVRGFLQVSSAMTLPMVSLELMPMDIHNICYQLRRKKERVGPRSMRFELTPGKPVEIIFEPWNDKITLPRTIYKGNEQRSIKVWGRRRLHILERLIPISNKFTVQLLGDGMPSFYIAQMDGMSFTLGLSGWSASDWSQMGNFDLLAPRAEVDEDTSKRVYKALSETWKESSISLAQRLQLDETIVKSALAIYSQHGQVLYDLASNVYRIRELSKEALPIDALRFENERDKLAENFVKANLVTLQTINQNENLLTIQGTVLDNAKTLNSKLLIDQDMRIKDGSCDCHFFHKNKFRQGPCEHQIALRKKHSQQILGFK